MLKVKAFRKPDKSPPLTCDPSSFPSVKSVQFVAKMP
jgi:hypothetical protein